MGHTDFHPKGYFLPQNPNAKGATDEQKKFNFNPNPYHSKPNTTPYLKRRPIKWTAFYRI